MTRLRALAVSLLALLLLAAGARAQPGVDVKFRAVAREAVVKPGDPVVIAVEFTFGKGLHSWPPKEITLPKSIDSFADRTDVVLGASAPHGAVIAAKQWPEAHPGTVLDFEKGGTTQAPVYSGKVVAYVTVALPADVTGDVVIPIAGHYQACNDTTCFESQDPEASITVKVTPTAAPAPTPAAAELFKAYRVVDRSVLQAALEAPTVGSPPAARTLFGFAIGGGLLLLFLAAVIGGAVLNLTPCVLPVIPLKIMALVHHAGSPGRRVLLGFWMMLGVVAFWSALAVPTLALRGAGSGDPSQLIFGTWWLTLSIGLLIAVMGLGIMGLFMIQLPQAVYAVNPKADTAWGSFLYGVMAGVLGLPCFGFVAGGLLAGLVAMPWAAVVAVFVGLGVGMGAPYLILAMWPALIERIPRTGPASELVKQVMGLLLLGFAGFFVASGIQAVLKEMPYVAKSINIWIVTFFVVLTALWLTVRTLQISRRTWPKILMPALAILVAGGLVAWIARGTSSDRADWMRASSLSDDQVASGAWLDYTPQRLEKAHGTGKVIVADFTADWCGTCKYIKRAILDAEPLASRLRRDDVILLEVDCTVKKVSPGSMLHAKLGLTGVPQLAIWAPGEKDPMVVFGAYTSNVVLDAVEAAKKKGETRGVSTVGGSKATETSPPTQ